MDFFACLLQARNRPVGITRGIRSRVILATNVSHIISTLNIHLQNSLLVFCTILYAEMSLKYIYLSYTSLLSVIVYYIYIGNMFWKPVLQITLYNIKHYSCFFVRVIKKWQLKRDLNYKGHPAVCVFYCPKSHATQRHAKRTLVACVELLRYLWPVIRGKTSRSLHL